MQAFLVTAAVVALAEFGDKTQMLALVLAARFRRPAPILLGILCATLVNHALAAALGRWVAATLGPQLLRAVLGVSFIAIALWTLKPDRFGPFSGATRGPGTGASAGGEAAGGWAAGAAAGGPRGAAPGCSGGSVVASWASEAGGRAGSIGALQISSLRIFGSSLVGFFVLEMGDKTQLATITLAARYHTLVPVLAGSTLGMLSADAIAVLLGEVVARNLPLAVLRALAAAIFLLIGVLVLLRVQA